MISQEICPGKAQLIDLIEGKLADAEEAEAVRHIEDCEECQRAVEQLARSRVLQIRIRNLCTKSRAEHCGEWADQLSGLSVYKCRYCRE